MISRVDNEVLLEQSKRTAFLAPSLRRPLITGAVTVQDVKKWVSEQDDVSDYLCRFTDARMIISSLEVLALTVLARSVGVGVC